MATGKGSGLLVARSSPAFMHPTFQAFYAAGRLDRVFAKFPVAGCEKK
jgi:hypothetical protein